MSFYACISDSKAVHHLGSRNTTYLAWFSAAIQSLFLFLSQEIVVNAHLYHSGTNCKQILEKPNQQKHPYKAHRLPQYTVLRTLGLGNPFSYAGPYMNNPFPKHLRQVLNARKTSQPPCMVNNPVLSHQYKSQ